MIGARVGLGAFLGLGVGACFQAPGGPVLFSCEPAGKSACPPGYECREDGCCHDRDTPDGADEDACKLTQSDGTAATEAGTASESGTAESGTASESGSDTEAITGTDSGSGSGSGSASDTSAESSSTAAEGTSTTGAASSGDGTGSSTTSG